MTSCFLEAETGNLHAKTGNSKRHIVSQGVLARLATTSEALPIVLDTRSGIKMTNTPAGAAALMWCGNPKKWTGSGGMESYVAHVCRYVYWSTPPRQCRHDEIQIGKRAYIWRTASDDRHRGIIAIGAVAEKPRQYLRNSVHLFARPERFDQPNWTEDQASSEWKTGISITAVRLRRETGMLTAEELERITHRLNVLKNPRSTVFRIDPEQFRQIEALWKNKIAEE
jgi:hypothetical protein